MRSPSVESKEFFAGIKVILEESPGLLYCSRNLDVTTAVSALTRRHSRYVNCEVAECVVKKQKSQSCFSAPHVLKLQEG